ncbi:MAG: hypothetical protein ABTQ31_02405 [Rhizobiaceae bacterium]
MTHAEAGAPVTSGVAGSSLMVRIFYGFVVLAVLSLCVSLGGKMLGRSVILGGHTDDRTPHLIAIGDDVLSVPANMIRQQGARHDGAAKRLDLYLLWPALDGYTAGTRDEFNHVGGRKGILFVSIEERSMSQDMSGRLRPIYDHIVRQPGTPAAAGLVAFDFKEGSGYANETLMVAAGADSAQPFAARCLSGRSATESLAPCERDVHVGKSLSLTYRFPAELLPHWRELEAAMRAKAEEFLGARDARP